MEDHSLPTLILGTPTGLGTALAEALVARGQKVVLDNPGKDAITRLYPGPEGRTGQVVVHNPNRADQRPCRRMYEIIVQPPSETTDAAAIEAEDARLSEAEQAWQDVQLAAGRPFQLVMVCLRARENMPPEAVADGTPDAERAEGRDLAQSLSATLIAGLPGSQVILVRVETDPQDGADAPPSDYDRLVAEALDLIVEEQAAQGEKGAYASFAILHPPSGQPLAQRD